jgi:DnaJ-domain-containing protein 1
MAVAFQYRPRFKDIRVRPPKSEDGAGVGDAQAPKSGVRICDQADCRAPASTRAPKSREHYWFCQAHAAEDNRSWNFFAGMTEGEIRDRMAEDLATGGRPTWSVAQGGRNREAAAHRGFFRDPFGIFGGGKVGADAGVTAAERRMGKLERGALVDLGLDATATAQTIRERYVELVKRCHPDANGGDRSSERKLQRVIRAYKTLRKAKLA